MNIFLVHMPFLISHLPPANSFFQKTSILKNLILIDALYFFHITWSKNRHCVSYAMSKVSVNFSWRGIFFCVILQ